MYDIIRDSPIGQVIRYASNKRIGTYLEESASFELPSAYTPNAHGETSQHQNTSPSDTEEDESDSPPSERADGASEKDTEKLAGADRGAGTGAAPSLRTISRSQSNALAKEKTIEPRKTNDGVYLVTWYSEDDPENPQNWSDFKKYWTGGVILVYTFAVYVGSSLYTTGTAEIMTKFGVTEITASLGLALYVIGYGVGPLLFAPLSEIPAIGRNPPYAITFTIFVLLCIPTSLVDNFAGLMVLRFLLGFFGSPCLATGAASYGDFFHPSKLTYCLVFWGGFATLGPSLGPLLAGFAVMEKGWRWAQWELLWISGPILIFMLWSLPETSSDNILLRRAQRLRALTGRTDLQSESEIKQKHMSPKAIAFDALIKPWEINALDPAVLFTTVYVSILYGIYYSWFEVFPLVYVEIYHFDLGVTGLAFLSVLVGLFISAGSYCAYIYFVADPHTEKVGFFNIEPEYRVRPALVATFFIPIGLFIFAWTSRASVHWIASMIGIATAVVGIFIVIQCMFIYLPFTYPKYAGSLFAANDFARSSFAAGAILYARPMFLKLGIAGGVSLLAGLTCVCVLGVYAIYYLGPSLRKRSKFAQA